MHANNDKVSAILADIRGSRLLTKEMLSVKGITYHVNHLRKLWNAGKFPEPVKLSARRIAWREEDIETWMASQLTVSEARQRQRQGS